MIENHAPHALGLLVRKHRVRIFVILLTIAACVTVGATAGPMAFATELHWPLSDVNLRDSICLGIGCGISGGFLAALTLLIVRRERLLVTAVLAVTATWLIIFTAVWWLVVMALG